MTFLEKWITDHPDKNYVVCPPGCPATYGYESAPAGWDPVSGCYFEDETCAECWNRPFDESEFINPIAEFRKGVLITGLDMPIDHSILIKIFPDGRIGFPRHVNWFTVDIDENLKAIRW